MGCGCGGNAARNSANAYHPATAGFRSPPQEWLVTFPDGRTKAFDHDVDAYREARLHGGGIQQRAKQVPAEQ